MENVTLSGRTLIDADGRQKDRRPASWFRRQWEHVDAMAYLQGVKDCTISDNRLVSRQREHVEG